MYLSGLLQRFVFWLQSHRLINALLVLGYFLFIVFMHDHLVHVSVAIEHSLGITTYNTLVAVVFLVLTALVVFFLWQQLRLHQKDYRLKLFYLFATLTILIIHSRFMFDSNVEVIHAFEFSFLALLIFPFTRRFGAAVFFTLPFMLVDEWYQYAILYPQWIDYYDLNDVLMDTYGCGLMMVVLMISGVKGTEHVAPLWKRTEFIGFVVLVAAVLLAVALCIIAPYASDACSNTLLIINERTTPEPFLRQHPTHGIFYHVMKPEEGLVAISLLFLFYFGLDSLRQRGSH